MPNSPDVTLHVYQVLEEEYVALHGSIGAEPLRLKMTNGGGSREVEATLGWELRLGHIVNPTGFAGYVLHGERGAEAERLREAEELAEAARTGARRAGARRAEAHGARRPDERLRLEALRAYLVERMEAGLVEHASARAGDEAAERAAESWLAETLNAVVLTDPGLYSEERFSESWLRVSTRELLAAYPPEEAAAGDESLRRLNRLLLEDAFPAYFERIYEIRLAAMFRRLHEAELSALCLSGGGIRSGTFALGLIQGLARHDLLKQFDYLSTVSGGGYVGSWLSAWLHRHPEGLVGVSRELENSAPASRVDPDPKPVQNLREYSNFITPKTGLLTADTWSFVGIYLRNLLLNWLVFIPLLAAALMLPRLLLTVTLIQPVRPPKPVPVSYQDKTPAEGREAVPAARRVHYEPEPIIETLAGEGASGRLAGVPVLGPLLKNFHWRHLLLLVGFGSGAWALGFVVFNRPGKRGLLRRRNPRWHKRTDQRSFVKYCLTWLLVSAACLTTYWAWLQEGSDVSKNPLYFLLFGAALTGAAGAVAASVLRKRARGRGEPEPEPEPAGRDGKPEGVLTPGATLATLLAGVIAGLLFWLVSLFDIGDPVIGYGASVRDGAIVRRPFEWTDWTQWTWWGSWTTELYVCLGVPIFLLIYWAALTAFVGVSSASERIDDEDREWWARFGAWLLIPALGWAALTATVIFGPLALLESPKLLASVGGLSGLAAVLLGRSSATPAGGKDAESGSKGSKAAGLLAGALPLLGAIFLGAFAALVSLGVTGVTRKVVTLVDGLRGVTPAPAAPATPTTPATPTLTTTVTTTTPAATATTAATGADAAPPAQGPTFLQAFARRAGSWMTNVPEDAPGGGPNRGFDDYVRYVTPVVPTLTRPTPPPRPGATPCQPVCVGGLAEAEGREPERADAFKGAQIVHLNVLHHTSLWFTLALAGLLYWAGRALSRRVNLNVFSLHGGYRNRLIRAFLGASRPPGERRPNPFTGFDPADNVHMHELRWALFDEGDFLKPDELAQLLRTPGHPVADYLQQHKLVEGVAREPASSDTPGTVEALRTDLNSVLERERLFERFPQFLRSKRAAETLEAIRKSFRKPPEPDTLEAALRGDYQLLLNRLVLEEAFPGALRPGPPPPYKLMHVVNTSLNLVGGEKLAWQQRKAEPFSVSPLHSGCFRLGYRRSRDYGGRETGGISIGTAAAISGAAASSNMGYYTTSPVISLLLTLFNVRLGWWLGNPGPAGAQTYPRNRPESSVAPVLYEAFGLTNDRYEYVYLTDGGHFENLAAYEMVLRRCRFVVVADGAQDEDYRFGDLGNAVRKIRIDLGVPIHFPCVSIYGQKEAEAKGRGMYWALGRIRYSCVDGTPEEQDGLLLYIKPAVYGDEPRDILEYKSNFPAFPHQSTGDQFFDEPQFESYRALGSHIMDRLCGEGFRRLDVKQVVARARDEMLRRCAEEKIDIGQPFIDWLACLAGEKERGDDVKDVKGADEGDARRGGGGEGGGDVVNDGPGDEEAAGRGGDVTPGGGGAAG